jgi:hypothetical protein
MNWFCLHIETIVAFSLLWFIAWLLLSRISTGSPLILLWILVMLILVLFTAVTLFQGGPIGMLLGSVYALMSLFPKKHA